MIPDPVAERHTILNVSLRHTGMAGSAYEGDQRGIPQVPILAGILRHAAILAGGPPRAQGGSPAALTILVALDTGEEL